MILAQQRIVEIVKVPADQSTSDGLQDSAVTSVHTAGSQGGKTVNFKLLVATCRTEDMFEVPFAAGAHLFIFWVISCICLLAHARLPMLCSGNIS